jgi:hypothetical protein
MSSVGREPDGKADPIPKAITDPADAANTAPIGWTVTDEKVVGNSSISGTVTSPAPTGKHSQ